MPATAPKTMTFSAAIPDDDIDAAEFEGSYGSQDGEDSAGDDNDGDSFSEGGASMYSDEMGVSVQLDEEETKPLTPQQ
jgi:hypothetical protein